MEEPMWYIEPVSETGPADLGNADVYKRMDLWMEAGKFIEHWDVTEDLNKQGRVLIHSRNRSANITVELHWVHHSTNKLNSNSPLISSDQHYMQYKAKFFHLVSGIAVLLILIGLAGLVIKLKKNEYKRMVKITKCSASVWLIMLGVMMSVSQATLWAGSAGQGERNQTYLTAAGALKCLVRLAILDYKVLTTTFFDFQNIVMFKLSSSSSLKKGFSSWLVKSTLARWLLTTTIFLSACLFLTQLQFDQDDCGRIYTKGDTTEKLVARLLYFTFLSSFLLSCSYLVGYYKTYTSDSSVNQIRMNHALHVCSLEIVFDLGVVLYIGLVGESCLTPAAATQVYQVGRNCTEVEPLSKEDGIMECVAPVLASQPIFHEIALLLLAG